MRSIYKQYLYQFSFWFLALSFYFFLRTFGKDSAIRIGFVDWSLLIIVLSTIAAICFAGIDFFLKNLKKANIPFGQMILRSSAVYVLTSIALYLITVLMISVLYEQKKGDRTLYDFIFSEETLCFIIYSTVAGVIVSFIQEINKKFGPGTLIKFINGKFYSPTEDERIFMFLDLKSSTKTAETLGHKNYSAMIQECFRDISVIDKYGGEFYQFVGDEAVITWPKVTKMNVGKAIKSFFQYQKILEEKGDLYRGKYGIKPEFKGSIHGGKVMIAEVGEIKREIAYHGDPINTTARIQSMCNELGEVLLVSGFIGDMEDILAEEFYITRNHQVLLKGKTEKTTIFGVREVSIN